MFAALSELFDKADSSRDGKISMKEYVDMCETYGVALTEEDIKEVLEIADEFGEVINWSPIVSISSNTQG